MQFRKLPTYAGRARTLNALHVVTAGDQFPSAIFVGLDTLRRELQTH